MNAYVDVVGSQNSHQRRKEIKNTERGKINTLGEGLNLHKLIISYIYIYIHTHRYVYFPPMIAKKDLKAENQQR